GRWGRRPRAHGHGVVASRWQDRDARLLPGRGRTGPALLAVPRRFVRPRADPAALVPARIVRVTTLKQPITYAEIGVTTNFSFLRGASHPQDYVHQAGELGLHAVGVADHNTLAGVVRAYSELNNPD